MDQRNDRSDSGRKALEPDPQGDATMLGSEDVIRPFVR
jgi:hypothetical protein